jgi:hypothetical protein
MALRDGGGVTPSLTHSVDGTKRFKLLSLKGPVGVRHEDIWQRCTRYCVRGDKTSSLRLRFTEEEERGSLCCKIWRDPPASLVNTVT